MAHSAPTQESFLVIGGGTSLGENIVEQLLNRGETRVSIFDAQPLVAEQTARFGALSVCVGDILVPETIADAVKSCAATCIIHTGMVSTPIGTTSRYPTPLQPAADPKTLEKYLKDSKELHRKVSTDGMRNVLAAALEGGVTQLLYVSSADVVFDGRSRPRLREADAPYPAKCWRETLEPQSHAERMVRSFNGVNALRTAVIRPAMLFGPSFVTAATMRKMQVNPKLAGFRVGDDAAAVTDHTYVANAAHAALLAADRLAPAHPQHAATAGTAFFITDGAPRPLWDFMGDLWVAAGGAQPPPLVAGKGVLMFASGAKDVVGLVSGGKTDACKQMQFVFADRSYDIGLAREVLGYKPIVSHEEGIRRVAEWWLEQQLKQCKYKKATTGVDGLPPYNHEEATLLSEKSPFF